MEQPENDFSHFIGEKSRLSPPSQCETTAVRGGTTGKLKVNLSQQSSIC